MGVVYLEVEGERTSRTVSLEETDTSELSGAHRGAGIADLSLGACVGRYVVFEELGRGGMGCVVRAYDPKLERQVALKVVRRELLGSEGRSRLEAEARAMARLSNPNVVAVYDVEQVGDDIVIVMEYVKGQTLGDWSRAQSRSWQEVLRSWSRAGQGLAAAHDAGLLHRDFKPANVLVAEAGDVKVTDFGLAKTLATDTSVNDAPTLASAEDGSTRTGAVMGTPRYMAPEQHGGGPLTPAADQYAFCVSLWEALHGAAPFMGPALAADKRLGPPQWSGTEVPLHIVAALERGLAPKPSDRWPSMRALLDTLAPRRRSNGAAWGVALTMAAVASVATLSTLNATAEGCDGATAALGMAWGPKAQTRAEEGVRATGLPFAADAWQRAAVGLDAYADDWVAMHTESCQATRRGEQSDALLDLRTVCLHRARQDLGAAAEVLAAATPTAVANVDQIVAGLPKVSRCADVDTLMSGVPRPPPDEADAVESVRAIVAVGHAQHLAGNYDAAWEQAEAAAVAVADLQYKPVATEAELLSMDALERLGRFEEAEASARRAIELASATDQDEELSLAVRRLMLIVGSHLQRQPEALALRELATGLSQGHPDQEASLCSVLGAISRRSGDLPKAQEWYERSLDKANEAYGDDSRQSTSARYHLAMTLASLGAFDDAKAQYQEVIRWRVERLGPAHPETGRAIHSLGALFSGFSHLPEAVEQFRIALPVLEAAFGRAHFETLLTRGTLGVTLVRLERFDEGLPMLEEALADQLQISEPDSRPVATAEGALAYALSRVERDEEAEAHYRNALRIRIAVEGPEHPNVFLTRQNFAMVLISRGKYDEAQEHLQSALEGSIRVLGPKHRVQLGSHDGLRQLHTSRGDYVRALESADAALAIVDPNDGQRGTLMIGRAEVLMAMERPEEARAELEAALAVLDPADPAGDVAREHLDELR